MTHRQFVIERSSVHGVHGAYGKKLPLRLQVNVDDRAEIGPWVTTLAVRFGYPLVDHFGSPIAYRLRSVSGELTLPTRGRFADIPFRSGSRLILEPDLSPTMPQSYRAHADMHPHMHADMGDGHPSLSAFRVSRRSLTNAGILTIFSLLGLGSGTMTGFAQRLLAQQRQGTTMPTVPASFALTVRTTFRQHRQVVRTVTWAPDGSMVASGGNDGHAFVWALNGAVHYTLQFDAQVRALAWSPDGGQLAAGVANVVSFFDAQTGAQLATYEGQQNTLVTSLGWTTSQTSAPRALSAGTDKLVLVWDASSHQPQVIFRQHTSAIEALAVLAETVVTVSEGGLARVWSALDGHEIHGYYAETHQPLHAVALAPGGYLAMGGDDGIVYLWRDARSCSHQVQDAFGGHCLDGAIRLQGHTHSVRAVAFSPDGQLLATGGEDHTLIIWSVHTQRPLLVQSLRDALVALSWSPVGQLLAGAIGSDVVLWQIHS